jgi:hypothetical protein
MSSVLTCPECATRCAVDQRYCTECGQRLRPRPRSVALTLAAMSAPHRIGADRLSPTRAAAGGASSTTAEPRLTLFGAPLELPSPRALAVAVMAMLAFGVIVGTSSFSLASSPLQVTVNRPAGASVAAPAGAAAPGTSPAPSNSAPAASGGSGSGSGSSSSSAGSGAASAPASSSSSSDSSSTASSPSTTTTGSSGSSDSLPPIKHVWVIELGDQGYPATFDNTSSDTYLNKTLASQGEVVPNVYASATSDLANELALVTGQGPTVQTEDDCPEYSAITPGTLTGGQVTGSGCVYPESTPSFESELTTAGDSWKAYVQGQTSTDSCIYPTLGSDPTQGVEDSHFTPSSVTGYETWRNPLVYLDDVTSSGSCSYNDTGLSRLKTDLSAPASTPNVSFIYPNSCDDGSDTPCLPGAASGTKQSDKFLKSIVPEIMASAAYKQDGMILITFAEAPQSGVGADQSSCCDQPIQYPNLPTPDYEPSPSSATTTTAGTTTTSATTTAGTTTTLATTTAGTTTTLAAAATTDSSTGTDATPGITLPDLPGPLGTTTNPGGVITGTNPTPTSTTACPTTTGTDTTGATTSTAGATTSATTTSADSTASVGCCPTSGTTTTGTTTTGTTPTGTDTTDTGSTPTATDSTASVGCCPTSGTTTTGTTTTGTDTTATDTTASDTTTTSDTATGTTSTGTTTTAACASSTSPGPDSTSPTGGGGQTGMLVLSRYVSPNLQDGTDYFNTFSITASLEQLFGLKYTGYASISGLPLFSGFFYSNYNSG